MSDSVLISGASALFTIVLGLATYALKYAIDQRDKEVDRRLKEGEEASKTHERDLKDATERLRQEEMRSIRLEGEMKLQSQAHSGLTDDLNSIKNNIVSRQEWESRMSAVERMLQQILTQLTPSSRYSSQSGGYRAPESGDKPQR
jgi:hypothetical protein